jgi:hypothetical protein
MVEIIGLGTMAALIWLLDWSMAGESDAERRRLTASGEGGSMATSPSGDSRRRQAA